MLVIRQMYQLCQKTQDLEKDNTDFHLATRMCLVFKDYITELGDVVIAERQQEVSPVAVPVLYSLNVVAAQILRMAEDAKNNKSSPEASASDPAMIESILRLFKYMPFMVKNIFKDNPVFNQTMKDAFTHIVNKDAGKYSINAMLAAYVDSLLKVRRLLYETFN